MSCLAEKFVLSNTRKTFLINKKECKSEKSCSESNLSHGIASVSVIMQSIYHKCLKHEITPITTRESRSAGFWCSQLIRMNTFSSKHLIHGPRSAVSNMSGNRCESD